MLKCIDLDQKIMIIQSLKLWPHLYLIKKSAIHSFAITENYAVFFFPPMTYQTELGCLIPNRFHVLECMAYLKDEPTDVFVVNLKTGKVHEIQVQ